MKKILLCLFLLQLSSCFFEEASEPKSEYLKIAFDDTYTYPDTILSYCDVENFCGEIKDDRDGQSYEWTMIKNRKWFRRSMNLSTPHSECSREDCEKYGRLYSWLEAMDLDSSYSDKIFSLSFEEKQGICPEGWRVPNKYDWVSLGGIGNVYEPEFYIKDQKYIFNPDTILHHRYEFSLDGLENGNMNLAIGWLFAKETFTYKNYKDPLGLGLIAGYKGEFNDYLVYHTADENGEYPSESESIVMIPYSPNGGLYYTDMHEKSSTFDTEMGVLRCVQTISDEEATQIWIDGLEKALDIDIEADYTYEGR